MNVEDLPKVGLIGGSGMVGKSIRAALSGRANVISFSRRPEANGFRQLAPALPGDEKIARWIYAAHIRTLGKNLHVLESFGAQRVVVLSSTSIFTKAQSDDSKELSAASEFRESEANFASWAQAQGANWLIVRPTLIYGRNEDNNISEVAKIIKRVGFFPLFGSANGLRRPIHTDDVGDACVRALFSEHSGKAYNVSGAEVLPYREMVRRIFVAMGRKPVMPTVPLPLFNLALKGLRRFPRYAKWTPQMAVRMNTDMAYNHNDAAQDLGFSPRPFNLGPEDVPLS